MTITAHYTGVTSIAVSSGGTMSTNIPVNVGAISVGSLMNEAGTSGGQAYCAVASLAAVTAVAANPGIYVTVTYPI